MKICWDNLENVRLTKNGYFIKNGSTTYVYADSCKKCGHPYLMDKYSPTNFCSRKCSKNGNSKYWLGKKHTEETKKKMSESALRRSKSKKYLEKLSHAQRGPKGSNWKGGVSKLGLPLYDTYNNQLWLDESKPVMKYGLKLLQIKCSKCKSWFIPSTNAVQNRMKFIKGKITSECRFYCSDECRVNCEVFGQYKYPKGYKQHKKHYSGHELEIWRSEVLKRADNKCEYCGNYANIAHHIMTKKLEPFFALDPDYGLAVCDSCHNTYGHSEECSTGFLANRICK